MNPRSSELTLWVCDTPIGRTATPICLDFLSPMMIEKFTVGVNAFLVPAMSPQTVSFAVTAEHQGRANRALTALANAERRGDWPKNCKRHSFCYVPRRRSEPTDYFEYDPDIVFIAHTSGREPKRISLD